MRLIPISILLLAVAANAEAHTLAADESIPLQLGHQILGLHHLPLTALLVIGGILLVRNFNKSGRIDGKRMR